MTDPTPVKMSLERTMVGGLALPPPRELKVCVTFVRLRKPSVGEISDPCSSRKPLNQFVKLQIPPFPSIESTLDLRNTALVFVLFTPVQNSPPSMVPWALSIQTQAPSELAGFTVTSNSASKLK